MTLKCAWAFTKDGIILCIHQTEYQNILPNFISVIKYLLKLINWTLYINQPSAPQRTIKSDIKWQLIAK